MIACSIRKRDVQPKCNEPLPYFPKQNRIDFRSAAVRMPDKSLPMGSEKTFYVEPGFARDLNGPAKKIHVADGR